MSDALGSIVLLGVAGAVFAALGSGGRGATPYLVVDAVMALVCVAGAVAAARVRPDTR